MQRDEQLVPIPARAHVQRRALAGIHDHAAAAIAARPVLVHLQRLLDGLPIPAILLDAERAVVARNQAAQGVPNLLACVAMSYGRVVAFAGAATEPFEGVFRRAMAGFAAHAVVTLRDKARSALWRVSLGRMRDTGGSCDAAVLMLVYPPADAGGTLVALQRLFDLTAAEARVLSLLLDDRRPREIAAELDVSITTVRSQLQALFAKTGTRRQSELVALAWSAA